MSIAIYSTLVAAMLAAMGIVTNSADLLIASTVIGPLEALLTDIALHFSHASIYKFLMISIASIAVGAGYGYINQPAEDGIKRYEGSSMRPLFLTTLLLILGAFTGYLIRAGNSQAVTILLVGVSIATTMIPLLVDIGLRIGSKRLDKKQIIVDAKLFALASIIFTIGIKVGTFIP